MTVKLPIMNFKGGMNTYLQPEVLPDDAFPDLEDTICYRGVLRKRDGYETLNTGDASPFVGSLAISTVTAGASTTITTTAAHNLTTGQQVTIGGVVGTLTLSNVNNASGVPLIPYVVTVTGANTFTVPVATTGVYTSGGTVYQPIMGLREWVVDANELFPRLIAFNETQAFLFTDSTQQFSNISGGTTWTGTDVNFFWSTNYAGSFWATNNVDAIRYFISGTTWTNFNPVVDGSANTVTTALMLFPYKDRLVMLNTTESDAKGTHPQRARWSQNGTPYIGAPTPTGISSDATAWRQDIVGKGGFIDAPTSEEIVTAGFVRDTLVVMFTRSSWRLRYTGNETLPFIWERIDSTYGAQGTFSVVPFDVGIATVGKFGITMTTVNACERIDFQIVDQVYQIQNNNSGPFRVYGIRDFEKQLVYWIYTDTGGSPTEGVDWYYPNKAFVYNYLEQNWAVYNWFFTCFGLYHRTLSATWTSTTTTWQETTDQWGSGFNDVDNPQIIAGDPQGQVFILQPGATDQLGVGFNWSVLTKKFNPFIKDGLQAKAIYMYLLCDGNTAGQFTINHFIDENPDTSLINQFPTPPSPPPFSFGHPPYIVNTATSTDQQKVWRRVELSGTGQYHQFQITFSAAQLADPKIPLEDYSIYQIVLEMAPAGRLNYGDNTT